MVRQIQALFTNLTERSVDEKLTSVALGCMAVGEAFASGSRSSVRPSKSHWYLKLKLEHAPIAIFANVFIFVNHLRNVRPTSALVGRAQGAGKFLISGRLLSYAGPR